MLLDIIGGSEEKKSTRKKSNKSEGGGIANMESYVSVRTSIGPDTTRGFSSEYQKSRGRLLRSLSVEAVEFVPYE